MKKLLILLVILFISISAASASDNFDDLNLGDSDNFVSGDGDIILQNDFDENSGSVESVDNTGDGCETDNSEDVGSNEEDLNISIQGEDLVWYINANPIYKFKAVDSNGSGVSVNNVSLTINKITKFVSTDENGSGQLELDFLKSGKYVVTGEYNNHTFQNKINLFSYRLTKAKDVSVSYGTKAKFTIKIVDVSGKPIKKAKVSFSIGDRVYHRETNRLGYSSLIVDYNSGSYTVKYSVDGAKGNNKYVVGNYIRLEILNWGLSGDVSKAPLIKNNMPNNKWVKKAVDATKKGIPLITIKGGKGKAVFMTAGVHGNELNSQVAAMKMIDYLTTHPIKGTVYIIPFVNVKAINQKVRLTNYDFNRVAHIKGTVSNNIIKLILNKKCTAYGDFHTTESPGVPGINVVLGYKSPGKCVYLTRYIAKNANVNKIFYYPGQKYCWSLADYCNYKGTPAVICEVISRVNQVSERATDLSYKQMSCYLKYYSII